MGIWQRVGPGPAHGTARHGTGGRWISPGGCKTRAASLPGPQTSSCPPHPRATPSGARLLPARQAPVAAGERGPTASPAKLALAHSSQAESAPRHIPCPPRHLLPFRAPGLLRPLPTSLPGTLGDPQYPCPRAPGWARGCRTSGQNFRAEPWRKDPGVPGLKPGRVTAHKRPHPGREVSGTLGGSGGEEERGSRPEMSPGNLRGTSPGETHCVFWEPAAARWRQRVLAACRGAVT